MGAFDRTPQPRRYELTERIAVGGMAEVFRARAFGPLGFEKAVAIKRILPALAKSREFVDRFVAEARISVNLRHANIIQILDFSRFGESLYIVMEFVDGADLSRLLKRARARAYQFPLGAALHLATEILSGLDYAHRKDVVHRDISPSNVLVSRAGEVKIADFGIARAAGELAAGHTRPFQILGKWRYMSPEQTRGARVNARSDLFSAGSVLFEVFTGRRLFAGDDPSQLAREIREGTIPAASSVRPDLPAGVDSLLAALLTRDPQRRTASAAEAVRQLVDISYGLSVPARPAVLAEVFSALGAEARGSAEQDRAETSSISAQLIDEILGSELARGPGGGRDRVTLHDPRPPRGDDEPGAEDEGDLDTSSTSLTFVEAAPDEDGLSRWLLGDSTGSIKTLAEEPGEAAEEDTTAIAIAPAPEAGQLGLLETERAGPAPQRAKSRRGPLWASVGGAAALIVGLAFFLAAGEEGAPIDGELSAGPGAGERGAQVEHGVASEVPRRAGEEAAEPGGGAPVGAAKEEAQIGDGIAPETLADAGKGAQAVGAFAGRQSGDALRAKKGAGARAAAPSDAGVVPSRAGKRAKERRKESQKEARERPRRGEIDLYVEPWAHVYLRGRKVGTAPRRGLRLPLGRHRLRLVNPVLERETTIRVEVPSRRPYRVKLPR